MLSLPVVCCNAAGLFRPADRGKTWKLVLPVADNKKFELAVFPPIINNLRMFSAYFFKSLRLLPFLVVPFMAWLLPSAPEKTSENFSPENINLALRRTADGLLRASGDSTSRIPAIEQTGTGVWQVYLEHPFHYEQLPALLQSSLDLYGIQRPYQVAVRRCADFGIDLGYHQLDFLQQNKVACMGREAPEGCHFIEIVFLEDRAKASFWTLKNGLFLLIIGGLIGFWMFYRRQKTESPVPAVTGAVEWLKFGNLRLDVAGQVLMCGDNRQTLTFRETKLLRLFATNPDLPLERDFIIQQVWADEGVWVGRSVDVFVSRLRKKLAVDPSVGIVAMHGVGYRLETGKV